MKKNVYSIKPLLPLFLLFVVMVLVACGGTEDLDNMPVSIDTMGLPYAWQNVIVPGTPYDESQPPGPMGLPEHIQILFGAAESARLGLRLNSRPTARVQ